MTAAVHCAIEIDPDTGAFVGWVVGFRHFSVTGSTPDEVEARLRRRVLSMHESGSLVLASELVRTFSIGLPQAQIAFWAGSLQSLARSGSRSAGGPPQVPDEFFEMIVSDVDVSLR